MATRHYCDICDDQVKNPSDFHSIRLAEPEEFRRTYQFQKLNVNINIVTSICERCYRNITKHIDDMYNDARTKPTNR